MLKREERLEEVLKTYHQKIDFFYLELNGMKENLNGNNFLTMPVNAPRLGYLALDQLVCWALGMQR